MKAAEEAWKNWGVPVSAWDEVFHLDLERLLVWIEMKQIEAEAKARLEEEALQRARKKALPRGRPR